MKLDDYLSAVYAELVEELSANSRIRRFTQNSDVIGAYAEASIHRLARRLLSPYRISTGAVISAEAALAGLETPQLDLIAWTPAPLPGLFEVENFALVPRRSVIGLIEIKRSNYSEAGAKIAKIFDRVHELTSDRIGIEDRSDWVLGVIVLLDPSKLESILRAQLETGRTIALLEKKGDAYHAIPAGVKGLINFLSRTRARGKASDGEVWMT